MKKGSLINLMPNSQIQRTIDQHYDSQQKVQPPKKGAAYAQSTHNLMSSAKALEHRNMSQDYDHNES